MLKIYFINLDRSPERLKHMRARLEALGLEGERIAGVDGAEQNLDRASRFNLTSGEVGCFLSHREIWRRLVASADNHALVLEDDARLSRDLPLLIRQDSWFPSDAGIVKLDTMGRTVGLSRSGAPAPAGRKIHVLLTRDIGSAGYVISREFAQRLLDESIEMREPVDLFLFGKSRIHKAGHGVRQMSPAMVVQERSITTAPEFVSLIEHERARAPFSAFKRFTRKLERGARDIFRDAFRTMRERFSDAQYIQVKFVDE